MRTHTAHGHDQSVPEIAHEIQQLVARFDDAINRRDADEFALLWTGDAIWDVGEPLPQHAAGATQVVATWERAIGGTRWLFRGSFLGQVSLDPDHPNRARGRWPCIETGVFADGSGYDNRAFYEDVYERVGGQWLFAHRRYVYLWVSREPLPGDAVALPDDERAAATVPKAGTPA